jgi:hypothetical protein
MAQLEAWVPTDDKVPSMCVSRSASAHPQEILGRIDDNPKIDLVVMATHRRHGVARLVLKMWRSERYAPPVAPSLPSRRVQVALRFKRREEFPGCKYMS